MPVSVVYDQEHQVVRSEMSGDTTPDDLHLETVQMVQLGLQVDCLYFLSDFSGATISFNLVDGFRLSELQDVQGLPRGAHIALVPPSGERAHQLADFYQAVSSNEGWTTNVVDSVDTGLAWLRRQRAVADHR